MFAAGVGQCQDHPVKWNFWTKKVTDNTYEIHLNASIDDGWHIYAQMQPKDAIAFPTKILFTKKPFAVASGKPKEIGKKEEQHLKELDVTQYFYADKIDFVQTITLKATVKTNISGSIKFMACTDERCLAPTIEKFSILIGN